MQLPEKYPYLIMTPDYRASSLGIQVMHFLCHLLNERGYKAWIYSSKTNPDWNTPRITVDEYNHLNTGNDPWVAIYPEIISGNPLAAPVVARYMLNREGVMNGNAINAHYDDLFYWYRKEFAEKRVNPNILRLETYDLDLFCNDNSARDCDLLYLNRVPKSAVDFNALPKDIEILSMANPLSLEHLSEKLKRARVLYSYESSGTNALAILCGCPVVALKARGYEQYAVTEATLKDTNAAGFAWDDNPQTLEGTRKNMGQLREKMLERRNLSIKQLDSFIETTQKKALTLKKKHIHPTLNEWLSTRQLSYCHPYAQSSSVTPRLLIAVHLNDEGLDKLLLTLESIQNQKIDVSVIIVGNSDAVAVELELAIIEPEKYSDIIINAAKADGFDWLQNIPAGTTYPSCALSVLSLFLEQNKKAKIVCPDEVWINEDGEYWANFRGKPEWESYRLAPHFYLKRCVLSRNVLVDAEIVAKQYPYAFEFSVISQAVRLYGRESLLIFPDVLSVLPAPELWPEENSDTLQILTESLKDEGYLNSHIEYSQGAPLRIDYGLAHKPRVSIILLADCSLSLLESVLTGFLEKNDWSNYEIIIVNHHHDNLTLNQWILGLSDIDPETIRVLQLECAWNPISLRNAAAEVARGEYFLFLDNNIIFVLQNWLSMMMNVACIPGTGCVGPKIIDTNMRIVSAGVIAGYGGLAGHIGVGNEWNSTAYAGKLMIERQQTLLDGQCLLVSAACWKQINGLNPEYTDLALAELDFLFEARRAGYITKWTPHSIVATQGVSRNYQQSDETDYTKFSEKWLSELSNDENYSVRWSLDSAVYSADQKIHMQWLGNRQAGTPCLLLVGDSEHDDYAIRMFTQIKEIESQKQAQVMHFKELPDLITLLRLNPHVIIFSGNVELPEVSVVKQLRINVKSQIYYAASEKLNATLLAPWLYSSLLDGWLTYSREQQRWLTKKKQNVVDMPLMLIPSLLSSPREFSESRGSLRVLCDVTNFTQPDYDFFINLMMQSFENIHWIIRGDISDTASRWIHEVHRAGREPVSVNEVEAYQADLAVIIRIQNEDNRFKDDYCQHIYQYAGLPVMVSRVDSVKCQHEAISVNNKVESWIAALDAFNNKRISRETLLSVQHKLTQYEISAKNTETLWRKLCVAQPC